MPSSPADLVNPSPPSVLSSVAKKVAVVVFGVPLLAAIVAGSITLWAEQVTETSRQAVAVAGGRCDLIRRPPEWLSAIAGDGFHTILDQTSIVKVNMKGERIGDDQASKVLAVPNLESLDLEECKATSACLPNIAKLKSLRSLSLSQTQVTDISALATLPVLDRLDLSFSKVRDANLSSLSQFPKLRIVNAGGLILTDRGIEEIAKCPELVEVNISGATLSPTGLQPLHTLTNLKRLFLNDAIFDRADFNALKAALPGCAVSEGQK